MTDINNQYVAPAAGNGRSTRSYSREQLVGWWRSIGSGAQQFRNDVVWADDEGNTLAIMAY